MSSDSDKVVFEKALEPEDNTILFQGKKWTYITDNSSNGGTFSSQLQFNLNTLANLDQWTDLSQGIITFPVKLNIAITSADNAATGNAKSMLNACIKNGFHQFVDSVQITVGGATIQSSQIYENVNTQFKILSEWSLDEYNKWGPSLGISLDDYQLSVDAASQAFSLSGNAETITVAGTSYAGIANTAVSTVVDSKKGFNIPANVNSGFKERAAHINNDVTTTTTSNAILKNAASIGKGQYYEPSATATASQDVFTVITLATIRLKDISDAVSKLPVMKGLKGFIYVNYNAASVTITTNTAAATIKTITVGNKYGHTMPGMFGSFAPGTADTGKTITYEFTADIDGTAGGNNTILATQQNARLYVPYYVANPDVDRALSHKKTIRYLERFHTSFEIGKEQGATVTLSPGVVNPKRVILLPLLVGDANNGTGLTTLATNPELSPYGHEPAGSSPFAAISNLQFIVGGVPMFQTPIDMDWQTFQSEITQIGHNGGLEVQSSSGLLNQRLWDQLYRFYTCDIGRRLGSSDGCSKSVIVQCNNATKAKMRVLCEILYEKEIEVDTVMGNITMGM